MPVYTLRLRTERLELRRFEESDVDACFRTWMSDPEVARFITRSPHRDVREIKTVLRSWIAECSLGSMDWCITLRSTSEPVGNITAVRDYPDLRYYEVEYCLAQAQCDRDYMTEALTAVSRYILDITD